MTIKEFIKANNLTIAVHPASANPHMDAKDAHETTHWGVTIWKNPMTTYAERFDTYFSMGSAFGNKLPKLDEVLDCLASDAHTYAEGYTLESFCIEFGYDTDSRRAERTYKTIIEQSRKLEYFLGTTEFNTLVYDVERL